MLVKIEKYDILQLTRAHQKSNINWRKTNKQLYIKLASIYDLIMQRRFFPAVIEVIASTHCTHQRGLPGWVD